MKLLVFGKTGQVAQALQAFDGVTALGRDQADLTNPGQCARQIQQTDADAVINAAAYTAVDAAESDAATAQQVNAITPGIMAQAAAARGLPFVHISTDYVFDGSGTDPWPVDGTTGPLNIYGSSKLAGENAIAAANGPHAILRTSWVFSATGSNFVKTMLRLSETRDALTIVADQIGGPTAATDIARACVQIAGKLIAQPNLSGTYHFSGAPAISWAGFARRIFALGKRDVTVSDIKTADYPTLAQRPLNSRLECSRLACLGLQQPRWEPALTQVLQQLETNT
jgi:dTDP-4-dehydrorhamnose reductase